MSALLRWGIAGGWSLIVCDNLFIHIQPREWICSFEPLKRPFEMRAEATSLVWDGGSRERGCEGVRLGTSSSAASQVLIDQEARIGRSSITRDQARICTIVCALMSALQKKTLS